MNSKIILELAIDTGEHMLRNGCGTHRIEGIVKKILETHDFTKKEIFITTSGIVVTIENAASGVLTMVKHVPKKSMHMERIAMIEDIVQAFVKKEVTAEEALKQLHDTATKRPYSFLITTLAFGGAGAFRTLMFGGSFLDGVTSFLTCLCLGVFVQTLNARGVISFLVSLFGGFIVGFAAVLIMRYGIGSQLDKIIIGSLMPIAPGVPFTHAVNDILNGEHISGNIRAMEAVLTAIAIATGIAFALKFWTVLAGGTFT